MAAEVKNPSPFGKWEKTLMRANWWVLLAGMLVLGVIREPLGFWLSLALVAALLGAFALIVGRLAGTEREARILRDVERGLIECAIRYPRALPGSLRSRWERGFAEVNKGTIRFRPLTSGMSAPAAEIREFTELHFLGSLDLPPKKPSELTRSWKIAAIGTDKGDLEIASGEAGRALLASHTDAGAGPS